MDGKLNTIEKKYPGSVLAYRNISPRVTCAAGRIQVLCGLETKSVRSRSFVLKVKQTAEE